jgi:hypothetical protein
MQYPNIVGGLFFFCATSASYFEITDCTIFSPKECQIYCIYQLLAPVVYSRILGLTVHGTKRHIQQSLANREFQVSAVLYLIPVLPTAVFGVYVTRVFNLCKRRGEKLVTDAQRDTHLLGQGCNEN